MTRREEDRTGSLRGSPLAAAAALAIVSLLIVAATPAAQAQTFNVIHTFAGGQDGATPWAGLTMDRAGNLYGTTAGSATGSFGTVFKLVRRGSGWVITPLHNFTSHEGISPVARVVIGPDGTLYGTTSGGGGGGSCGGGGCGTVFRLTPPATACKSALCPWTATVLYRFTGGTDGGKPLSEVVFDHAGNLYGTASVGGILNSGTCSSQGCGVVYQLSPSNGSWTESVVYSFTGGNDGRGPSAGLIFDTSGNLYSTTYSGGTRATGSVYQLAPSGSGWTRNTLYSFQTDPDGVFPVAGVIFDQSGNLYGTTGNGGDFTCYLGCGTVFSLSPSGGGWVHTLLYAFTETPNGDELPSASLVMDAAGNLYGTTYGLSGTVPYGNVFELAPSSGGWIYTPLHDFTNGADGGRPRSNVVIDANGNLYGTTSTGGSSACSGGCGVVWEIMP